MTARRCPDCGTDWPPTVEVPDEFDEMTGEPKTRPAYTTCPECQKGTTYRLDREPIGVDEAASRDKHARFERYFAEWEAARIEREVAGAMAELEEAA